MKNKEEKEKRFLELKLAGVKLFEKPRKKSRKIKTLEEKTKEQEGRLMKKCIDFFEDLIINKISFRQFLRSEKKSELELILFNNDTDDLGINLDFEFIVPTAEESTESKYTESFERKTIATPTTLSENYPFIVDEELWKNHSLAPSLKINTESNDEKDIEERLAPPPDVDDFKENMPPEGLLLTPVFNRQRVGLHSHHKIKMPSDAVLNSVFMTWDNKFHFFDDSNHSQQFAMEQFKIYYKICKIIGDFSENTADIDIVSQAYKMLVLFGDQSDPKKYFTSIGNYLEKFYSDEERPLHEALIYPIPINGNPVRVDLKKWREIIHANGPSAFQLFNRASEVEEQLKKPPETYEEAYEVSKKLKYKNADKNPDLADICMDINISEKLFDRCLAIDAKRKTYDNLPNITINGSDMGFPGYYLLKLPIDDPNAFVLGYVTKCCQSIGGDSERCVQDGIQRPNNGFYVLLKNKALEASKLPSDHKPLKEGKIDYDHYEIVGQGYAWISAEKNLVFDSWENARNAFYRHSDLELVDLRDDEVIVPMLNQFAKTIVEDSKSGMLRVTIGNGGKTPHAYKNSPLVQFAETMLEGSQYNDSKQQHLVYLNVDLQDTLFNELSQVLEKIISESKESGIENINSLIDKNQISSIHQVENIKTVLLNSFIQSCFFNKEAFQKLFSIIDKEEAAGWAELSKLIKENLLNKQVFDVIFTNPTCINNIASGLINLKNANMLNDDTFQKVILKFPNNADQISSLWIKYNNAGIIDYLRSANLFTEENARRLFMYSLKSIDYQEQLIEAIKILKKHDKLNEVNFLAVMSTPSIGNALSILCEAKIYDTYHNSILSMGYYSDIVAKAIVILRECKLDDEAYINKILTSPDEEASALISMFELYKEGILDKKIFHFIKQMSAKNADQDMTQALIELHHEKLLKQDAIVAEYIRFISTLISNLEMSFNRNKFNPNAAIKPACRAWFALHKFSLLNDENCSVIQKIVKLSPEKVENVLKKLNVVFHSKGDITHLDLAERQKIFETVIQSESHFAGLNLFKKRADKEGVDKRRDHLRP